MKTSITLERACALLRDHDDILILAHMNPDGDTLGSCFALRYALRGLGKRVRVECSDKVPERYAFLLPAEDPEQFEPKFIVAADIADTQLFGSGLLPYAGCVDLTIDHHPSNVYFAKESLVVPQAAATAEIMTDVFECLGIKPDAYAATCLYTGLSTDTGCFRFSNTTAKTLRAAAFLVDCGVNNAGVNYAMFSCKTKSRIDVEREVYNTIEYHFDGRCALVCLPRELLARTGADESELDGVSSLPAQIEGVEVGVTLREKEGGYKISLRTNHLINASELCAKLEGGGHARAAGCFVAGTLDMAKEKVLALLGDAFHRLEA